MATLVTGGTGKLGRVVAERLSDHGHTVRVLSRRGPPAGHDTNTWATADLRTGQGLEPALAGVETVVHCASGWRGDAQAAGRLADAANRAGVAHLVYISIVGVDAIPMFYYQAKLEAERQIERSGIGHTILRATQFHDLVAGALAAQHRFPAAIMPARMWFQPVDVRDVADRLSDLAGRNPGGRVADFGGPEIRTAEDLARTWLRASGKRELVLRPRIPGKIFRGFASGANLAPDHADGVRTFDDYIAEHGT